MCYCYKTKFSQIYDTLAMEHRIVQSPTKSDDAKESSGSRTENKSMSPVLNKTRYSRKTGADKRLAKEAISKATTRESEKEVNASTTNRVRQDKQNSSIPVPINPSTLDLKTPLQVHKPKIRLVQLPGPPYGENSRKAIAFQTDSSCQAVSQDKSRKYTSFFNYIPAERDSTIKYFKRDSKFVMRNPISLDQNEESKCASGDVSEMALEHNQFMNDIEKSNIDMLYQNRQYEGSITTMIDSVGDVESKELNIAVNVKISPIHLQKNNKVLEENVKEKLVDFDKNKKSQLNYNVATDESSLVLRKDINKLGAFLDDSANEYFDNFTQNVKNIKEAQNHLKNSEVKSIKPSTSKNIVHVNVSPSTITNNKDEIEFKGFDVNDLIDSENYRKYTGIIKDTSEKIDAMKNLHSKKKKVRKSTDKMISDNVLPNSKRVKYNCKPTLKSVENTEASLASSFNYNYSVNTNKLPVKSVVESNKKIDSIVKGDKISTICSSPTNRVQISIATNKVKIHIKSDNSSNIAKSNEFEKKYELSNNLKHREGNGDIDMLTENVAKLSNNLGFQLASKKSIAIGSEHLLSARKLFEDNVTNTTPKRKILKPRSLLTSKISQSTSHSELPDVTKTIEKSRENTPIPQRSSMSPQKSFISSQKGLNSNLGSSVNISKNSIKKELFQFGKIDNFEFKFKNTGFCSGLGKSVTVIKNGLDKYRNMFSDIYSAKPDSSDVVSNKKSEPNKIMGKQEKTAHELIEDVVRTYDTALSKVESKCSSYREAPNISKILSETPVIRKTLGGGKCRSLPISQQKLNKAKELFADLDIPELNKTFTPNRNIQNQSIPNFSTPICNRPVKRIEFDLTPIKTCSSSVSKEVTNKSTVIFRDKSCEDFAQLQINMDNEYNVLKKKLKILEERRLALEYQRKLMEEGNNNHRRMKPGKLFLDKQLCEERVPLSKLLISTDEHIHYFDIADYAFQITPRNAEKVHFNVNNENHDAAVITTTDGAVLIPNSLNIVGLTEVTNALCSMEGVNPNLLPKGWVANHYKWIVWKLASYKRKFPQYFKDCMTLENVMQQLKYRYDREIDKAERSAIRKILETDDVPQKRLVLCVADIIQIYNNKFELELTDGWYSIRTVIDPPLCRQIYTNKISIGTKLITQGAEMLHCDGCHPLEVPSDVRLKISFNSTRRVLWHTKLGYYKYAMPFPLSLTSASADGGVVCCVRIYVARIYPVRYLEEVNGKRIWRNVNAEEKKARESDNLKMKQMETIKQKILSTHDKDIGNNHKISRRDKINEITCPETLYNLVQNDFDPESMMTMLSASQQHSVLDYKQKVTTEKQKSISMEFQKQMEANSVTRAVIPVLTMLVVDTLDGGQKSYVFNIWRPAEEQMEMLKEESSLVAYNISVRRTGELNSTSKTFFKPVSSTLPYKNFQRQLLPIAMTFDTLCRPPFNEFDTIGIVIVVSIAEYKQELWLADCGERLLVIRIVEEPSCCCLLDNLKRGQIVAVSNLVLHRPNEEFGQAVGNQYTVISQYPKKKYLQNHLDVFKQYLPEDMGKLLTTCETRIENVRNKMDISRNVSFMRNTNNCSRLLDDSTDDNATLSSQITATDVAMSLINTDQYL